VCNNKSITQLAADGKAYHYKECTKHDNVFGGWPDVLLCGQGNYKGYLYFLTSVLSDKVTYQVPYASSATQVVFNVDKTWNSAVNADGDKSAACNGKSITTLISENKTKNFYPLRQLKASTSILDSRPDAITCGQGVIFYANKLSTNSQSVYRAIDGTNDNYIIYNADADGTFGSRNTNFATSAGCDTKSLKTLYDDCKAFNFVSSKPTAISGTNTNTLINDWPYAIDFSTDSNVKEMFLINSLSDSTNNDV
jgi:hypothetical protein